MQPTTISRKCSPGARVRPWYVDRGRARPVLLGRKGRRDAVSKLEQRLNAREVVNPLCPRERSEPTTDPADRAHRQYQQGTALLRPARDAHGARPRRYHPANMAGGPGHRVEFGTVFEQTAARQRWLEEQLGAGRQGSMAESVAAHLDKFGPLEVRDRFLRPRTRVDSMTAQEAALDRAGSILLAQAGLGPRGEG